MKLVLLLCFVIPAGFASTLGVDVVAEMLGKLVPPSNRLILEHILSIVQPQISSFGNMIPIVRNVTVEILKLWYSDVALSSLPSFLKGLLDNDKNKQDLINEKLKTIIPEGQKIVVEFANKMISTTAPLHSSYPHVTREFVNLCLDLMQDSHFLYKPSNRATTLGLKIHVLVNKIQNETVFSQELERANDDFGFTFTIPQQS